MTQAVLLRNEDGPGTGSFEKEETLLLVNIFKKKIDLISDTHSIDQLTNQDCNTVCQI